VPSHLLQFIGGLAFFFYGLYVVHQGLHIFAGDRLKGMIARTTQSRFKSLITGILVTIFFQSSSAVTVMTTGLASSGLITLSQAMAIYLGAGIGTTFVSLLIAIKGIMEYGILILVLGMGLKFFGYRRRSKIIGEVMLGLGLIFFGLNMMSLSTEPLKSYPYIPLIFEFIQNYPVWNFLIATLITVILQSSSTVMGILISLAYAGSMSLPLAFPMILGANVGTCFTAIATSLKSKTEGKRAAWSNLFLRSGAVLILAPFLPQVIQFIEFFNDYFFGKLMGHTVSPPFELALTHFYFNVFAALFFLPLLPLGQKFICWLIPANKNEGEVFGPRYLDSSALESPTLAFAQVSRELLRMGEIVQDMFNDVMDLFSRYDLDLLENIEARDHKVDTLYRSIKFYMARLSFQGMKGSDVNQAMHTISAANELESIGDTIDKHLIRLVHKKWNKGVAFSDEGWQELLEMHKGCAHMMDLTLAAMASSNQEIAQKMRHYQHIYANREGQIKISHLKRLNQGLKESIDTSSIHLEIQAVFFRINLSLLTIINHMVPDTQESHHIFDDNEVTNT